jgi:lipid-binding SYLF domain-containing protein
MGKLVIAVFVFVSTFAVAQKGSAEAERLQSAVTVLNEVMQAPDKGIPQDILRDARCVAVIPSMLKGGFVLAGQYGKGIATCRTEKGWSAPAFFLVEGGGIGFQIGGQAIDLLMVVMNDRGMNALLSSKFKLGADASVAAGPVGRHAEGMTDWKMRAQVLTYSRARGVFAGISLNGASIRQDKDATRAVYGRMVPVKTSLLGRIAVPAAAQPFVDTVAKYAAEK